MIEGSFLPSRFRGEQIDSHAVAPSWLNKKITSLLQAFTRITASRPIHIIVIATLLASSSYIGLLEDSLVNATSSVRKTEWSSLAEGSRRLRTGPDTAWTWQNNEIESLPATNVDNIVLLTLVFSQTMSTDTCRARPSVKPYATFANISATPLPPTSNSSAKTFQEGALAFAVPYSQVSDFLAAAQKISSDFSSQATWGNGRDREETIWVIENSRVQTGRSFVGWVRNAWIELLTLIKNTDALDIAIMVLGYTSMHLTFISLSFSMRRIGSNFWLTTSVLLSSCFAFLFGLFVTTKLGHSPTAVLLSEGLPFLVVIIGFEKNVVLARAVLSHAADHRRSSGLDIGKSSKKSKVSSSYIQSAIQAAVEEQGFDILKHYAIEIGIVVVGAIFGVEGGLQQFCFLAAWILFFDCILLFSFYTAILCVKLEINRIKRHVDVRKALEDDGLSHQVAEKVAQSNDWPGIDGKNQPGATIFGRQLTSTQILKFKIVMVSGFILINAFNISSWARGFGGGVAPSLIDPFDIASSGLDVVLSMAKENHAETIVTVIAPIRYELEMPSVQYHLPQNSAREDEDTFGNLRGYGVGRQMVGSVLKSFEDPVLSKLIVVALILSVALNGYLFNAPTTGIKYPDDQKRPIDPEELAQAEIFNDGESITLPPTAYMGSQPSIASPTPASTDDEGDTTVRDSQRKPPLPDVPVAIRGTEETEKMLLEKRGHELVDEEVIELSMRGKILGHSLEKTLKDFTRAVKIRRAIVSRTKVTAKLTGVLQHSKLPYQNYNWAQVFGACCENVVGYMPVPVGVAGPLVIDGTSYFIPMATTEGVLVASTSRGCKAINSGGGAITVLTADGMTRGPCVSFERLERAGAAKMWLDSESGQKTMKKAFNSTSRFARLETMKTALAGTLLFIRFKTTTGDAMGMNMISKGVEHALSVMMGQGFDDMNIVSVSGNYCTDKKAAAINWTDGRGKSVVAEAIIPREVVKSVLKTDVDTMVELNISKNLIGSAMAGSIGGFNAHVANIVAAIFIATGQDPAQVVESANCITTMKNLGGSLQISVSMPSIEVGTLGGGTILESQAAMLDMLGVRGPHPTTPGENSRRLARIVAATALAGELSLCSALAAGHLIKAHMQHNRSAPPTPAPTLSLTTSTAITAPLAGLQLDS